MKVLKFGGTSVGSVKSILSLRRIVENEAKHQPVVVVVSALGGITDKLLETSLLAKRGDDRWKSEFEIIVERLLAGDGLIHAFNEEARRADL